MIDYRHLISFLLYPLLLMGQHQISGTFSPASDYNYVLLYQTTVSGSNYILSAELDSNGYFEIEMNSSRTPGMYQLVYALPETEYNISLIYSAQEDIELTFSMESDVNFVNSVENQLMSSYSSTLDGFYSKIASFYAQGENDQSKLMGLFKQLRTKQLEFESLSEGLLVHQFIRASKPYIPEHFVDAEIYSANRRLHYFDHIDFGNETLQRSNFLMDAVLNFIIPDPELDLDDQVYIDRVDTALNKIGANMIFKKQALQALWHQCVVLGKDHLAVHIADHYLLKLIPKNDTLRSEIVNFKKTAVGMKAPNFTFNDLVSGNDKDINLYDFDYTDYYLILFWSSTCEHCLMELPKLHDYLSTIRENSLKVIAIGLEDDPTNWEKRSLEYPEFIHVYGEEKWDNPIGDAYGVYATPSYFILDHNKSILAKPYDIEALKSVFNALLEKE